MPEWTLPDLAANPERDEQRWMIAVTELERFDPQRVADELDAAQNVHFAADGVLASVAPAFRIDAAVIHDVLHTRAGDIVAPDKAQANQPIARGRRPAIAIPAHAA